MDCFGLGGRWKVADHITLGEGRAHVRILQALAGRADTHDHRIVSLEDNAPVAFSMAKGRSCSLALNYLCRRRTAAALAANIMCASPWTQTDIMPADAASRMRF